MKRRLILTSTVALLVSLGLPACQHATDDGHSSYQPNAQSTSMHALARTETEAGTYLHVGYRHGEGWGLFETNQPQPTSVLDPRLEDHADIETSRQAQEPGANPINAVLFGEERGPEFSGSATGVFRFTAQTRASSGFSASAPGAGGDSLPASLSVSGSPTFSASVADTAGQTCSARGFCDFISAVCDYRPRSVKGATALTSCDNVQACYSRVDEIAEALRRTADAEALCEFNGILGCAAKNIRAYGVHAPESVVPFSYLAAGGFEACFRQYGYGFGESSQAREPGEPVESNPGSSG